MEDNALKQRILKVATFEFFTTGIRPVTMDSLSRKLKMSKRTLYEIQGQGGAFVREPCFAQEIAR